MVMIQAFNTGVRSSMLPNSTLPLRGFRATLRSATIGPRAFAFLPAIILGGFWIGGEGALITMALILPALYAVLLPDGKNAGGVIFDPKEVLPTRKALTEHLDGLLMDTAANGRQTLCLTVELDDFSSIAERFGHQTSDDILNRISERLTDALRDDDLLAKLDGPRFAAALAPIRHMDLEVAIQMAGRLQSAVEEPLAVGGTTVYISASVGFALPSRVPNATGTLVLEATEHALAEAQRNGPSAIRGYSAAMHQRIVSHHNLMDEVADALENGQICAWFQPQISTDTGQISGFEALARWQHPERGLVTPGEFLPAVDEAGLMERLGEVILNDALAALRTWDATGLSVPTVGVNFSGVELHNPKLIEKIKWELDRFDLEPERLCVEILETVVARPHDIITRNISGLSDLGCGIDLDDFGTGHASIASIRRFAVSRLKIDRSFVMKLDSDADQRRMVSAVLTMAERLGLDTLAEGVETVGEHAMLAQLGCGHIQGFGLARPMPLEDTAEWIRRHTAKLRQSPTIQQRTGT